MKTISVHDEIELLKRRIEVMAKQHDRHYKVNDYGVLAGVGYFISVEGPPSIKDEMADVINKSERAILKASTHYPGHYDWASGVYIKDCDSVTFTF